MRPNITQIFKKLTKNLLIAFVIIINISTTKADRFKEIRNITLLLPSKEVINTTLAITINEKTKGLSGVKKNRFKKNDALLFFYIKSKKRSFWMPNTFMNLDIIFLDKLLKIIKITRDLKATPANYKTDKVPRTKDIFSRHVLEMRSDSTLSKKLKVGMKLILKSSFSLAEIESKIRLLK